MTQEEKAKAYDEALDRARKLKENPQMVFYEYSPKEGDTICDYIFPELAESEDERIKGAIIDHLKDNNLLEWADWLEKQGEKPQGKSALEAINEVKVDNQNCVKPADKVEPKFKVGDWVVDNCGYVWKIEGILNQFYLLEGVEGGKSRPTIEWVNKTFHLWTIEDAKDGDVLVSTWKGHSYIYIFKEIESNAIVSHIYYYPELDTISDGIVNMDNTPTIPATKEQRDLLFKKMIEEGYEWDAEKKELKKMKVTSSTYCSENCKYDNMSGSCEIEHIEHGKYYYCIKDYYAGGNKRASKGDVVQAKRGMSMMALGAKANEYFLPVYQMPNQEWSEEMYKMAFSNCHL